MDTILKLASDYYIIFTITTGILLLSVIGALSEKNKPIANEKKTINEENLNNNDNIVKSDEVESL